MQSVTVKMMRNLWRKSYQRCEILLLQHYQPHNWAQQSSNTIQVQQLLMATKRWSVTETPLQNLLTARVKSLLHPLKQYCKVEVPRCYCNSDMKTVQKIQKDKIFKFIVIPPTHDFFLFERFRAMRCFVWLYYAYFWNGAFTRGTPRYFTVMRRDGEIKSHRHAWCDVEKTTFHHFSTRLWAFFTMFKWSK